MSSLARARDITSRLREPHTPEQGASAKREAWNETLRALGLAHLVSNDPIPEPEPTAPPQVAAVRPRTKVQFVSGVERACGRDE